MAIRKKREIFSSFAFLIPAVLLFTACPQQDYFASGSGMSSCCHFDDGAYPQDEGFSDTSADESADESAEETAEKSAEITVWITDDEGARQEYETLQTALDWLKDNAVDGGNYNVSLGRDQIIDPQLLNYSASNVSVVLISADENEKQISLAKTGSLFTIGANVALTLERGITLKGRDGNIASLVLVEKNGLLVMKDGSAIRDNKMNGLLTSGGGVLLTGGGVFTMNGGTISNNTASSGGGVYVSDFCSFTMTGGTISNNKASSGGGVEVYGYVYGSSGEFFMTGGVISNNFAEINGGGIFSQYAHKGKVVIGGNAVISANEANTANSLRGNSAGGGIYTSSIVLEGNCVIEGNKARAGAGVYLTYHESIKTVTFTMTGGFIRSNTAVEYGGGVAFNYLSHGQARDYAVPFAFEKTGGTIYGHDGGANANIVLNAVDKDGPPSRPGKDNDDDDDQGEDNDNQGGISIVPYGNDQGGNNNNQGNGNSQGGNGNSNGNNQGNQGNGNSQGGNGNNGGGVLADRGRAVFIFDLYWGQSYSGSDDVSTVYVHKETTSFPTDKLCAWDNRELAGAWD
jgi:hypothetical protein